VVSALHEIATARIALSIQKMGWMVGRSYDQAYDLLAYSPKHYRICGIQVESFELQGSGQEFSLKRGVESSSLSRCTHIAVYVEPKEWIYIAPKEKIVGPEGIIGAVLDTAGIGLDEIDNSFSFGRYRESWEELLC
jgi:hypothetical protein